MWTRVSFNQTLITRCATGKVCGLLSVRRKFTTATHHKFKVAAGLVPVNTLPLLEKEESKLVYYIDKGDHQDKPPLVLLAGTAQTIDTYTPHINQISKSRRLIIPELRGQGRTQLDPTQCTIEQQVYDLETILTKLGINNVHLSGFSFGGRVALAFAAHRPDMVSRLSLTAIPLVRPPLGKVVLESWMDGLKRGNMRECAWSFIINGYSNDFLTKNAERLSMYVDMVANSNEPSKVFQLMTQSSKTAPGDVYSIPHCAGLIRCPTQVIGASEARIAGREPVKQLAAVIPHAQYVEMNTGHLVPFEQPLVWRKHLMDFMNAP